MNAMRLGRGQGAVWASRLGLRARVEELEARLLLAVDTNAVENAKQGSPPSEWQVAGVGYTRLQGFATDMSVNQGVPVSFKVDDKTLSSYHIDIYRLGYYGGLGA